MVSLPAFGLLVAPVTAQASLAESLSGDTSSRVPTFFWGLLTLLIGGLWWWVCWGRPRRRRSG